MANLALLQQPWEAIFCKAPPFHTNAKRVQDHKDEMKRVVECLQGQHGFKCKEECDWALRPATDVDGFVCDKI